MSSKETFSEAWFLLTNLPQSFSRQRILNKYRKRWQIESTFKDLKWTQGLKDLRLKLVQSMKLMLLFVFLGWILLFTSINKTKLKAGLRKINNHKLLSWFNYLFEVWQKLALNRSFHLRL
ncbi:MAG: transposase [Candidatus Saccharibacteria bacterium]|nr:transposase [Candidatus Saccharibacteria bacterium]